MGVVKSRKRSRLGLWLLIVLLLLAVAALVLVIINDLPGTVTWNLSLNATWDLWAMLTAIGTVGATLVATTLALRSWVREKDATARFVSAWITDDYQPRTDGSSYQREVHLHVANESNEPVFDAMVNVHIGRDETPLGPLAAPAPISVIPPRRELIFDISVPMLAHSDSWSPKATLTFTDPKGRHWLRKLNGGLQDVSRRGLKWSKKPGAVDERQLGNQESLFNPMLLACMFLGALRDEETKTEDLFVLLAPEASGWTDVDWDKLRSELADFEPTSMVDYPAPRIARIKLSGDKSLEGRRVEGHGKPLELGVYKFMTLTLNPRDGWRIFGVGGSVPPDAIHFGGSLVEDVESYRGAPVADEGSE
jgi:hypothetical protein